MKQTRRKRKTSIRKTKKRNLPKHDVALSKTVNNVINEKLYRKYRARVVANPSLKNIEALETVFKHSIKTNLTKKKSYTPSINKKLVSIRSVNMHPLFDCNSISALENTVNNSSLKIKVIHKNNPVCISVHSDIAKAAFMNALKVRNINCSNLIVPIQFHANCWFNTILMCMFISDKGRKFTRFLRQAMIEGKFIDGRVITPVTLKNAFSLFNAAIEAVQNNNNHLSNESLALNTNSIIHSIYKAIPKTFHSSHFGIKDVGEYGNPIAFYADLIEYIDAKSSGAPSMKILSGQKEVSDFFSRKHYETSDIVVVQLYNSQYSPSYAKSNSLKKGTTVKHGRYRYKLDSAVIRDNNHTHFACCITCNKKQMIYDGAAFTKVVPKKWKSLVNKNINWGFSGSKTKWNFKEGYQILFYYKS